MVLTKEIEEKIKAFVYLKPRTINEIAEIIGKNWRTAYRYIQQMMQESSIIQTRTFREGTRGSLRIVYWNSSEKIYATDVQERLFKEIEKAINKNDFSPFEIYQYIDSKKRQAYFEHFDDSRNYDYDIEHLIPLFERAKEEIIIFAGNLAFIHLKFKKKKFIEYIKEAISKGVKIKIISNINLGDLKNVEELLSLNRGLAHQKVLIKHEVTPLRAYLFDTNVARFGEVQESSGKEGQISGKIAIYYEIKEKTWLEWIQKLFWQKFQDGIDAAKRIDNLRSIKEK